jgi:hypothetical protein
MAISEALRQSRRATVDRLDVNDLRYPEADSIRATRQFWVNVGVHPPEGDIVLD